MQNELRDSLSNFCYINLHLIHDCNARQCEEAWKDHYLFLAAVVSAF